MLSTFYDEMSPYYHLIFEDWDAMIEHQAKIIKGIIDREWGMDHLSIVDVSCGIGTQAIGLAQLGYEVEASDLSSQAIKRARQEAEKRNIKIKFSVADMRYSFQHHQKQFDLLISCDNSIPHLLSDTDILAAFKEFHDCIKPGGGCIITIRDYAKENCKGIQFKPYGLRIVDDTKYIIFQIWEFEADIYDLSMYFIIEREHLRIETKVFRSQYYAISISKIIKLLQMAGFIAVKQIESEFYQPIIIGKKTL